MERYFFIFITLIFLLSSSCDNSENNNSNNINNLCSTVTCEEWQVCNEGVCDAIEGRCNNYLDCNENMFCDDDLHICRGPTEPDDQFFSDLSGNSVEFSFEGRINTFESILDGSSVWGSGEMNWKMDGDSGINNEYLYVFDHTYPEDYTEEDLQGVRGITMGGSKVFEQIPNGIRYWNIIIFIPTTTLTEAASADTPVTDFPSIGKVNFNRIEQITRPWDQTVFRKSCLLSSVDSGNSSSKLFLNFFNNDAFEPGENLQLWGNIGMHPSIEITEENEVTYCTYRIGSEYVTKEFYDEEISNMEPELTCETPSDFFVNEAESKVSLLFFGRINDPADSAPVTGYQDATMIVELNEYDMDSYNSIAYQMEDSTTLVAIQSIGNVVDLGNSHYSYDVFQFLITKSTLESMKTDHTNVVEYNGETMGVMLETWEQKSYNNNYYIKSCPFAIGDESASINQVLACTGNNTDWSIGETLEIELNVTLTTDSTIIEQVYSYESGQTCHCWGGSNNAIIPCTEFDAM